MIATRVLMPGMQGAGGVWFCGSWVNFLGHSGALDAGLSVAAALGAAYPLEDPIARDEFYRNACYDLFGPRFDWQAAVRKHDQMKRKKSKL